MRNHAVPIPSSQLLVITKHPIYLSLCIHSTTHGYLGKPKPQFRKIAGYCTYTPAVPCLAGCIHDNYRRARFWGILQRSAGVLGFRVHGVSTLLVRNQTRPLTRSWPARHSLVLLSPRFNCLCFFFSQKRSAVHVRRTVVRYLG